MGRTKRLRRRIKRNSLKPKSLEGDPSMISLKKWMQSKGWRDSKGLKLAAFPQTGRGLTSSRNTARNSVLIQIPYNLMITCSTLDNDPSFNSLILPSKRSVLEVQDVLSTFLVMERHKGKNSAWKHYISSLPANVPCLPWLASAQEIDLLPADFREKVASKRQSFLASLERALDSYDLAWKCDCCGRNGREIVNKNSFAWSYCMVNTRSVYVDPQTVSRFCRNSSDSFAKMAEAPCVALCPLLDLFNHSNATDTRAYFEEIDGKLMYILVTLKPFVKYREIFISYGGQDNDKLLNEYGFFISDDELNILAFNFYQLLAILGVKIDLQQYKFVLSNCFDKELNVTLHSRLSFNLKAVLFIIMNPEPSSWRYCIFNDSYTEEDLAKMYSMTKTVIEFKLKELLLGDVGNDASAYFKNCLAYIDYRLMFVKRLMGVWNGYAIESSALDR